jgi:D-alanyl-D-alanine carboxypeptidase
MPLLSIGVRSPLAKRWNQFLRDKGWASGSKDLFDFESQKGTIQFQKNWNSNHPKSPLTEDGLAGNRGLGRAITESLNDDFTAELVATLEGKKYPPVPQNLSPVVGKVACDTAFGEIKFERVAEDSDDIRFLNDWPKKFLSTIDVPQLKKITSPIQSGKATFHKSAALQYQALWEAWEKKGLLSRINSYSGSYSPRVIRGTKDRLSLHAYAVAFDINVDTNSLSALPALEGEPGSVCDLVSTANALGFYWGGHFSSRFDGMHFEVCKILKKAEVTGYLSSL